MGNGLGKITACFSGEVRRRESFPGLESGPLDEGLGHSFCYVNRAPSSKVHLEEMTAFRSISGASVSANTSTPLSTAFVDLYSCPAAAFESSTSFASMPLQPVPRNPTNPVPGAHGDFGPASGPLDRGFLSGPIERGFMSGPIDKGSSEEFRRSFSNGSFAFGRRSKRAPLVRVLRRAISKTLSRGHNSIVAPIKGVASVKDSNWVVGTEKAAGNLSLGGDERMEDDDSPWSRNVQWAQGKAGEDRVHVVVSEEHGWVFVGIYDGFNGPDAPDYLLSHLYPAVVQELKGLLWDDGDGQHEPSSPASPVSSCVCNGDDPTRNPLTGTCSLCSEQESYPCRSNSRKRRGKYGVGGMRIRGGAGKRGEDERRRSYGREWERRDLERRPREQRLSRSDAGGAHQPDVLKALSQALKKTEAAYLGVADQMLVENPELALMGSCVLVMLMKGEDVYIMNVGDSRAVLAQEDLDSSIHGRSNNIAGLESVQLSMDHSTSVEEEVSRIRIEHEDDEGAVINDRLKGTLKVTRAFGAGFLKQPKWNDALLEVFRIDYIGSSPYLTCSPFLCHHRLGPKDRFMILSSDGLYQYFTNEEAVSEVEMFISSFPEGDPAQHLVEELLFRAARKAGLDFHELLEIPQGDRRRYHDDVSIIVISLEGRIWRSWV